MTSLFKKTIVVAASCLMLLGWFLPVQSAQAAIGASCAIDTDCNNGEICDTTNFVCIVKPAGTPTAQPACPDGFERVSATCVPKSTAGGVAATKTLSQLITTVINYMLYLSGTIAIIFIILGGFWYMTSGGNDEQAEKGQKALTNAVIGLVLVILAYVIVNVVVNTLTSGTPGNSTTNTSGNTGVPSNVQYDPNNRRTVDQ